MSITAIQQNHTVATVLPNGVLAWSNPDIDVLITSEGKVLDLSGKELFYKNNTLRTYAVAVQVKRDEWSYSHVKFASLYAYMVLGVPLKSRTIVRKDDSKPFIPENVRVVSRHFNRRHHRTVETVYDVPFKPEPKVVNVSPFKTLQPSRTPVQPELPVVAEVPFPQFYTTTEAVVKYITEDFAEFPTLELANWHQDNVSKAKGNAQVVLDFNGGWQLAEAIFGQDVKYNKARPYQNFRDVMENNTGIKDISEGGKASFKDAQQIFKELHVDTKYINTQLYKNLYSLEDAATIQEKLEEYCKQALTYQEALKGIKVATKALNTEVLK